MRREVVIAGEGVAGEVVVHGFVKLDAHGRVLVVEQKEGSLKTTVKLIGETFVGSACPTAWLIVTVGAVTS